MISGLWNGVSGLNTFEKALSTQSNNVTNSNTIAHKKDEITFEDMMYQSRYGKGVTVQGVEKNFEQGNLQVTNNTLDAAIDGDGFFVVLDTKNNETYYTRAGNFKMGTDGYLESVDTNKILGTPTTTSGIVSSDDNTQFDSNYTNYIASKSISTSTILQSINSKSTDFIQSAADSGISGSGFKTASGKISDIKVLTTDYNEKLDLYASNPTATSTSSTAQVNQIDYIDFESQLTEGTFIEIYVDGDSVRQQFDTDAQTTMNKFSDKLSNVAGLSSTVDSSGVLTINTLIPGKDVKLTSAAIDDRGYGVNEITTPVLGTGIAMLNSSRNVLKTALENADAKFLEITNSIADSDSDLSGIGQIQLRLNNLGLTENAFGELSIEDGVIYAKDQNNKFLIGKLETAYFANAESLDPLGSTLYAKNDLTGDARNASNLNNIVGQSIELSNTNFSEDLVDLMVYQRAFEASSKSITTSDEFLKTAIELKK